MGKEELQKLYNEGDKHNVGAILKGYLDYRFVSTTETVF